jgi:hypothetical protein
LLFATPDGVLMAQPIDPATAVFTGPAVQVAEGLAMQRGLGFANYAVSESETLIYEVGGTDAVGGLVELVWVTRSGDATLIDPGWQFYRPASHIALRLSPDGEQVALTRLADGIVDIWIKQLPDGPFGRLTLDDNIQTYPDWSTDGQFVTYVEAPAGGNYDVWRRRADGTGEPMLLLDDECDLFQARGSTDGEWMVFRVGLLSGPSGERDIVGFRPGVDSEVMALIATAEFEEQDPALSPDGLWLAYTSDLTGQREVYVSPFPNVDSSRVRVSINGGFGPLWAHSGNELFFVDADRILVAAEVETASGFRVVDREPLFAFGSEYVVIEGTDFYDIALDDQQFLMVRVADAALAGEGLRFILVQNFFEELLERLGN